MRIILIDTNTGYIWGDSADHKGGIYNGTPEEYAAALDASLKNPLENGQQYVWSHSLSGEHGYAVYRADVNGSDAVGVVWDGQSLEMIESVERDCQFLGYVIKSGAA